MLLSLPPRASASAADRTRIGKVGLGRLARFGYALGLVRRAGDGAVVSTSASPFEISEES